MQYFPFWLAPNLITFVGFLLTAINYLLIAFFDYDFTAASSSSTNSIPPWVFLVVGINVFVAYTLDGIDGKQARRTGSSNPLGELFDHGLDSYSTLFIMVYLFSLFGVHDYPVIRMHYMTFLVYMNFYVSLQPRKSPKKVDFDLKKKYLLFLLFAFCRQHTLKSTTPVSCFYHGPMTLWCGDVRWHFCLLTSSDQHSMWHQFLASHQQFCWK